MDELRETRETYYKLKPLAVMAEGIGDDMKRLETYERLIPVILEAEKGKKGKSMRNIVLGFHDLAQKIEDSAKRLEYYEALIGYIYDGIDFMEYEHDTQLMLNMFVLYYEYGRYLEEIWSDEE